MGRLSKIAAIFNRDSLIENGSNITREKGTKNLNKGAKIAGAVLGAGLMMASLTGCPQPIGPLGITPQEPETPRRVIAEPTIKGTEPTTAPETEPVTAPENEPETEPTNGAEATNGNNGTSNRGSEATITPDPSEPEDSLESDPIEPNPTFDPSLYYTPQSHTQIGNSPYELHFFGDGAKKRFETYDEAAVFGSAAEAHYLDGAQNYFKGKAQQIENNTADRPAIRAYYQDLINTLNSVDQYSTMGDITTAVNEMAGRYMGDIIRNVNSSTQYDAIETAYKILALENMKSGFGADFVGYGDNDYRIKKENFMQELAETNPDRNAYFKNCNFNINDEYTNGFVNTTFILDKVTGIAVRKLNANDSKMNNQLTLADEQMVYDVALATRALRSTARLFNSGFDRTYMTETCQMSYAYSNNTYTPIMAQQNSNEQGL